MPEGSIITSSDVSMGEDWPRPSSDEALTSDLRPLTLTSSSGDDLPPVTPPPPPSGQSPPAGPGGRGHRGAEPRPPTNGKGRSSCLHNNNNNNTERMVSQASRRRHTTNMAPPPQLTCVAPPPQLTCVAPPPQLTYLDRVVLEIIETERTYVRDLRMIVEDYLAHIIDCSDPSFRPEQVCLLFGNIEDIYEFNSELLQDLDLCERDPVAVARCFVTKSQYFEIYTQYCTNYPNSVAALTDCMRSKPLAQFFRERQAQLKRSLPLGSFLLKPVQRILKYHLLLQEIAKHFDPVEASGLEVVEEAIDTMTTVAWSINNMKRRHEHAVRLQEVQSLLLNWKGHDLTVFGELVLEGNFKVHRVKNERTLFLFQRALLITKRRGEHYVYKTHISCSTLMLIENAKDCLSFSVTHYKHPKQPHTLQAKSVEEKKLWSHHIKRLILENHHAVIPQKAKDAILEMDSIYPPRYHPERRRKAPPPQPADGGREQSAPDANKHSLNTGDTDVAVPCLTCQLLDREGGSRERRRPLQAGSGQDGSEVDGGGSSLRCPPQAEDTELDRLLPQDEQEDDFANSLLSALSCWSRRFHVSLSTSGTDDDAASVEPVKENGGVPERAVGAEERSKLSSKELLQEIISTSGPMGEQEPDFSDPELATVPGFAQGLEEVPPELVPVEPPSATPDSDSRTLSSAESSEEEEEEEDKDGSEKEDQASRILPSSVLDQSDSIAQHFTNSVKRGGAALSDSRSRSSPQLPIGLGSLGLDPADPPPKFPGVGSDLVENHGAKDSLPLSPRDDGASDPDRSFRRRRDSFLSKQDQLLIGKIKSYYENAENQDATFSLQRRESLTFIPTGLVRSSVTRFNSIPKDRSAPTNQPASGGDSLSLLPSDARGHMVSSDSLDSLKSDLRSSDPEDLGECLGPHAPQGDPSEEQEFRPSSDMIKIWQAMEREVTRPFGDHRVRQTIDDITEIPDKSSQSRTAEKESLNLRGKSSSLTRTRSLKGLGEETPFLQAATPRVHQSKVESEWERPREDSSKSKVLHLARQYSQRMKSSKPVRRQQSQGALVGTTLSCVEEENERTVKRTSVVLPDSEALTPPDLSRPQTCSSEVVASPAPPLPPHSPPAPPPPHSPPALPIEGFDWPDVRELRSKYSEEQRGPVARSRSIPEQMFDLQRRSSCSSAHVLPQEPSDGDQGRAGAGADGGSEERRKRLHRANSLDPRLGGAQLSELQKLQDHMTDLVCDRYFVAAETTLPHDPEHKVTVLEKVPEPQEPQPQLMAGNSRPEEEEEEEGNYVEIRSPTSREKISILAVVERCRAYQESELYRHREALSANQQQDKTNCTERLEAGPNSRLEAGPNIRLEAGPNSGLEAGPNSRLEAGPNIRLEAGSNIRLEAGPNSRLEVGPNNRLEAGPNSGLEAGPNSRLEAGPNIRLEAGPNSRLEVGPNSRLEAGGHQSLVKNLREKFQSLS